MKFAAALLCALCGAAYAGSVYTPVKAIAWSASAGAGLAGIRSHVWTESAANTYIVTYTLHTATTSAVLPWEA